MALSGRASSHLEVMGGSVEHGSLSCPRSRVFLNCTQLFENYQIALIRRRLVGSSPAFAGMGLSENKRPIRHCEQSEAIQTWAARLRVSLGCFAVARNDGPLDSIIC